MYTGSRMMYHNDKKMADGCSSVERSKERMDAARYAGGALGNRGGNDLSDPVNFGIHVIQKKLTRAGQNEKVIPHQWSKLSRRNRQATRREDPQASCTR